MTLRGLFSMARDTVDHIGPSLEFFRIGKRAGTAACRCPSANATSSQTFILSKFAFMKPAQNKGPRGDQRGAGIHRDRAVRGADCRHLEIALQISESNAEQWRVSGGPKVAHRAGMRPLWAKKSARRLLQGTSEAKGQNFGSGVLIPSEASTHTSAPT